MVVVHWVHFIRLGGVGYAYDLRSKAEQLGWVSNEQFLVK
jgi:hypothetical protein